MKCPLSNGSRSTPRATVAFEKVRGGYIRLRAGDEADTVGDNPQDDGLSEFPIYTFKLQNHYTTVRSDRNGAASDRPTFGGGPPALVTR